MERVTHHKNAAGINIRPEIEQQREGGKDETGKRWGLDLFSRIINTFCDLLSGLGLVF